MATPRKSRVQLCLTSDAKYDSMSRCDTFLYQALQLFGRCTATADPSISYKLNKRGIAEMSRSIFVSQAYTASGTPAPSQEFFETLPCEVHSLDQVSRITDPAVRIT